MDEIFDTIDGYSLKEVYTILEKYRKKQLIPIEWIKKWGKSEKFYKVIKGIRYYTGDGYDTVWDMLEDWEKENEINIHR